MLPYVKSKKANRVYQGRGKMHYGSKSYSNPFFDKKSKQRQLRKDFFSIKVKLVIFLVFIIIFGGFWFLFYSNYFKIKNINIVGGGKIAPSEIKKITEDQANTSFLVIAPKNNIFLFKVAKLVEELEKRYSFNELKIEKKFPNEINISYDEKRYAFIWKEDEKFYYIGAGGEVISETTEDEIVGKNYPIIYNSSNSKIDIRQISIDHAYTDFIINLSTELEKYKDEFAISNYIIDDEVNTVKIKLTEGPSIYFNISKGIDEQIEKLIIIKREKIKDDFMQKTYIDLRVGNSVYYR